MTIDWDAYRAQYDSLSYAEHQAFYDKVWDYHPVQVHYSGLGLASFFFDDQARHVVEVGGWRGEAAAATLAAHPSIASWRNFEICCGAASDPVVEDSRYRAISPPIWVWRTPPIAADTAVLAHVIEHMRGDQVEMLLDWLIDCGVQRMYIETPIELGGQDFTGYLGSHVLELGWDAVEQLMLDRGFSRFDDGSELIVRFFQR